jgi:hypothetical protein
MGDDADGDDDFTLEVGVTENVDVTDGDVVVFTDGEEPLEFFTPGEVAPQCFSSVFVGTGLLVAEEIPPREARRFSVALVTLPVNGVLEEAVPEEEGDFLDKGVEDSILLFSDPTLVVSGDRFLVPRETPPLPGELLEGGVVVTPLPLLSVRLVSCPPTLIRLACAAEDDDRRNGRGVGEAGREDADADAVALEAVFTVKATFFPLPAVVVPLLVEESVTILPSLPLFPMLLIDLLLSLLTMLVVSTFEMSEF